MKEKIYIANGQGFWGDSIDAPVQLVQGGQLDYLTLDYLAEVTMSIMQRQKLKKPELGYATDFVHLMERILPAIMKKNIKVIANAGGVNPDKAFPPNGQLFRKWGARVTRKDGGKVDPKIVRDACIAWIRNLVPNATEKSELGTDGEVIRLKYTAPGIEGTAVVLLHSQEPAEEVRYDLGATEFKQ
ncbi:acyclic terpene utilization AtuA family protein [bacterium]|nr:acyclic terpene utilization AtuA family protein [bacterium]